jgi:hypothetical protein
MLATVDTQAARNSRGAAGGCSPVGGGTGTADAIFGIGLAGADGTGGTVFTDVQLMPPKASIAATPAALHSLLR